MVRFRRFSSKFSICLPGPLIGTTGSEKSRQQLHIRLEQAQYRLGGAAAAGVACLARPIIFKCSLTLFRLVFHKTSLFSGTNKQNVLIK